MIGKLFIIGVIGIVVACLLWPDILNDDLLGKWASIVTILSVASIPVVYWVKQNDKKREDVERESKETMQVSRNLCGELEDSLDGLENHPNDLLKIEVNGVTLAKFTNRLLNSDVYASLVFSGRINSVEYEQQQKIQDVFTNIENHNKYLEYVGEHRDDDENEQMVINYCTKMEKIEVELKRDIPPLVDSLKKSGFDKPA